MHRRSFSVGSRPAHRNEPIYENLRGIMFNRHHRNSPVYDDWQHPSILHGVQRDDVAHGQGSVLQYNTSSVHVDVSQPIQFETGAAQNRVDRLDPLPSPRRHRSYSVCGAGQRIPISQSPAGSPVLERTHEGSVDYQTLHGDSYQEIHSDGNEDLTLNTILG